LLDTCQRLPKDRIGLSLQKIRLYIASGMENPEERPGVKLGRQLTENGPARVKSRRL
jgi:hypothetical protein